MQNDYLVKPFAFEELLARVRVLLEKPKKCRKTCYTIADLEVHLDTHKVIRGKRRNQGLSEKSLLLLRYMVKMRELFFHEDRLSSICGIMTIWEVQML